MNKVELKIDGTYATSKDYSSFIQEKINDYYFIKFRTKWNGLGKKNKLFR